MAATIDTKTFLGTNGLSELISLIKTNVYDVLSDKIDSIDSVVDSIELVASGTTGLVYNLNINGTTVGTINIPNDSFVSACSYDETTHVLTLTFATSDESDTDTTATIDLSELCAFYVGGDGISVTEGTGDGANGTKSTIAIVIDSTSDSYLSVGADGLKLDIASTINDSLVALTTTEVDTAWSAVFTEE